MTEGRTAEAVILALGAAAAFAVSNVTQMEAVRRRPEAAAGLDAGVVLRVARDPRWLAGLATSVLGFALEAVALSVAPVVLVQPLIVAELPFALSLAAFLAGRRLGPREWTGTGLVTVGLVAVVAIIRPRDTPITAGPGTWLILFAAVAAVAAALLAVGHWSRGDIARTSAVAAAAGACFGLLSVVTKAATQEFASHGVGAVATWQPWALAGVGFAGLTLAQNAYRAGPLAVSLPLLDIGEPLTGSLIAVLAFGEQLGALGMAGSAGFAAAACMVATGVAVLDRSPVVQAAQASQSGGPGQPDLSRCL